MIGIDVATLLNLVEAACTKDQVADFLKGLQNSGVRTSARTKGDLIHSHLKHAIDSAAVDVSKVLALLRNAEENQSQHIFYYAPKQRGLPVLSDEEIGEKLWGRGWERKMSFPRLDTVDSQFVYSDLRRWDERRKPQDWVLKIYGQRVVQRPTGEQELRDNRIWKATDLVPERLVIVIRWNSPDLLEIRVPQGESNKVVLEWRHKAWEMIEPLFKIEDFAPWNLWPMIDNMVKGHTEYARMYRFSHTKLKDGDDRIFTCSAPQPRANLLTRHIVESMEDLTGHFGATTYGRVTWLAQPDGLPGQDVVVLLGNRAENEIVIGGHQSAEEIDYVTSQLRYFGSSQSRAAASDSGSVELGSASSGLGRSRS